MSGGIRSRFEYEIKPITQPITDTKENVDESVKFMPVPDPVPADVRTSYFWPIISSDTKNGNTISYIFGPKYTDAKGIPGRSFYGDRNSKRRHGAHDFFGNLHDIVLSCQVGKVIRFVQLFLVSQIDKFGRPIKRDSNGQLVAVEIKNGKKELKPLFYDNKGLIFTSQDEKDEHQCAKYTSAIYVDHYDKVIVYGEIAPDSLEHACLKIGDTVRAGQVIGFVGSNPQNNNMLHVDMWDRKVLENKSYAAESVRLWLRGTKSNEHRRDPTLYLYFLQTKGTVLKPGDKPYSRCGSKPDKAESTTSTSTQETKPLSPKFTEYVRSGKYYAAAIIALSFGYKDDNKITDLIFYARHPERANVPIKSGDTQSSREWKSIHNYVRSIMTKISQKKTSTGADKYPEPSKLGDTTWKPNPNTIGKINRFDSIIKKESAAEAIEPNLVKGIIYSESSGDPDVGKGTSGYKGLMQASQDISHLDPEISIREGIKHYIKKRNIIFQIYRNNGIDPNKLDENEIINTVLRVYNAGEGTVKAALEYARSEGRIKDWTKEIYYKRAIFWTGAFSYGAAVLNGFTRKNLLHTPDKMIDILAKLLKTSNENILAAFKLENTKNINSKQFYEIVKNSITQLYKKLYYDPRTKKKKNAGMTYDQLLETAKKDIAHRLVLYCIQFKFDHTQPYIDKIILVKRYFDNLS